MEFTIEGEIERDCIVRAQDLISTQSKDVNILIGETSATLAIAPDYNLIIATGGVIAAIASFAFELIKHFKDREKEKSTFWNMRLKELLSSFGVEDFEVLEVKNMVGLLQKPPQSCTILVHDTNRNRKLMVSISSAGVIHIKKK